jgi:hypothetical protein
MDYDYKSPVPTSLPYHSKSIGGITSDYPLPLPNRFCIHNRLA